MVGIISKFSKTFKCVVSGKQLSFEICNNTSHLGFGYKKIDLHVHGARVERFVKICQDAQTPPLPPGRQLSFVSLKAAKNNIKLEQNESTRRPIHGGSVTSSNIIIAYHDVWRACSSTGAIGSHESSHRSSPSSVKLSFATVLGALWHVDTSYEEGTVQRCGT